MSEDESTGARQSALHLCELLRRPGRYRRLWERHAGRSRPGRIHQGAVAEVLADHLRDVACEDGDESVQARQLKDKVGRALSGRTLSRKTLTLFVEAFNMTTQDKDDLVRLLEGSGKILVLDGRSGVPPDIVSELGRPGYLPISVHEHHTLGEDGAPIRHRTLQVIQATRDHVDRYRCHFDTNALTIRVGLGCQQVGQAYRVRDGVYSVDIMLASPISVGETATIEYIMTFSYRELPEPVLRKAVQGRIENVDLRVEFSPKKLPAFIWWTVWDDSTGPVRSREPVHLDGQHSVHRFLREMNNVAAGFSWEW